MTSEVYFLLCRCRAALATENVEIVGDIDRVLNKYPHRTAKEVIAGFPVSGKIVVHNPGSLEASVRPDERSVEALIRELKTQGLEIVAIERGKRP